MMDEKRRQAGQKLLDAAYEFWQACHEEGQYGGVQWLEGSNGELIMFTRGEYRNTLLNNIYILHEQERVHLFSESMPIEDDEEEE